MPVSWSEWRRQLGNSLCLYQCTLHALSFIHVSTNYLAFSYSSIPYVLTPVTQDLRLQLQLYFKPTHHPFDFCFQLFHVPACGLDYLFTTLFLSHTVLPLVQFSTIHLLLTPLLYTQVVLLCLFLYSY